MHPLRIGLIGCGRIARQAHLPVLAGLPGAELVALAEADATRRAACHSLAPSAVAFTDYRDLLARSEVEAVVICLPPALHREAAVASFERGLHVYLEKPIATTLEDGARVVEAWRRAGTVGRIGFNCRFHRLVRDLRVSLRTEILGEVVGVRTVFSAARRVLPEWKQKRRSGGGVLLDLASHHFDLVRFLFDQEIIEVAALVRSVASEDDTATIALRLERGPLVTVFATLGAVEEDHLEVYGSRGRLAFDRYRSSRLRFLPCQRDFRLATRFREAGAALASLPRMLGDVLSPPRERSFALALADFVHATRAGESEGPDLDDGLRSLAVVAAAERSAESGRTVAMPESNPAAAASRVKA